MSARGRKKGGQRLAAVFVCVLFGALIVPMANPPQAEASALSNIPGLPSPCTFIPDGALKDICESPGKSLAGAVTGKNLPSMPSPGSVLGNVAGQVANNTFGKLLEEIVQAEAGAVVNALKAQSEYIVSSSTPSLTSNWFLKQYGVLFIFGIYLASGLFFGRLGDAMANADAAVLFKAGGTLVLFLLIGGALPWLVQSVTNVADKQIAAGLLNSAGNDFRETLNELGRIDFTKSLSDPGNNPAAALLAPAITLFFGVLMGIVMKFMLFFREAALYAVTAWMAISMAMAVAGRWGSNMVHASSMTLLALVFFNCAAAVIMTLGVGMFGANAEVAKADPIILGVVVISMMPILTYIWYRKLASHQVNTQSAMVAIAWMRKMAARA